MEMPLMGDPNVEPNFEFPTQEELKSPFEQKIKLQKVEMMSDNSLTKLKLNFPNGVESHAYQSKGQNSEDYTREADPSKTIN